MESLYKANGLIYGGAPAEICAGAQTMAAIAAGTTTAAGNSLKRSNLRAGAAKACDRMVPLYTGEHTSLRMANASARNVFMIGYASALADIYD